MTEPPRLPEDGPRRAPVAGETGGGGRGAQALLALLAIGVGALWVSQCSNRHPLEGLAAPHFTLPVAAGDGAEAGDLIHLAGLQGEVVVLDFWATWCGPCRVSTPILGRVAARLRARGVTFVGVDVDAPGLPDVALRLAHRRLGAGFPSVADRAGTLRAAYRVEALPTLVFLDREGVVRGVETGVPDEAALVRRLEALLARPPTAGPQH